MNKRIILFAALAVLLSVGWAGAQERPQDEEINYQVRFARGKSSSVIRRQIRLGTTHIYTLRAREGQRMTVVLTTGGETSMTVYAPSGGIIEDADGVSAWRGRLDETGDYRIAIGTDETADYKLEIYIK